MREAALGVHGVVYFSGVVLRSAELTLLCPQYIANKCENDSRPSLPSVLEIQLLHSASGDFQMVRLSSSLASQVLTGLSRRFARLYQYAYEEAESVSHRNTRRLEQDEQRRRREQRRQGEEEGQGPKQQGREVIQDDGRPQRFYACSTYALRSLSLVSPARTDS